MIKKHPLQPLYKDKSGVMRFKKNAIVRFLLDTGSVNLSLIDQLPFSQEDREQFAQLIGYSFCGFTELDYISKETYAEAEKMLSDLQL